MRYGFLVREEAVYEFAEKFSLKSLFSNSNTSYSSDSLLTLT
jgi:hypothetical protein